MWDLQKTITTYIICTKTHWSLNFEKLTPLFYTNQQLYTSPDEELIMVLQLLLIQSELQLVGETHFVLSSHIITPVFRTQQSSAGLLDFTHHKKDTMKVTNLSVSCLGSYLCDIVTADYNTKDICWNKNKMINFHCQSLPPL